MCYLRLLYLMVILALCLAVIGCEQPKSVDLGPQLDVDGHRRSLALDAPVLEYLKSSQPDSAYQPWYQGRNDRGTAALAGYESPKYQQSTTYTRDRQYSSHGRTFDHYHSTTYRTEHRQSR